MQIFNREQSQLLATLLAVAAERNRPEGEPVITFSETPSNMAPALRYWYYAGETAGNEFVYPKSQAMTIARASGQGVMAVDTDSTNVNEWKSTPERVTANAEPQAAATASTAARPTPAPMTAAPDQPAPTTAPTTARTGRSGRRAVRNRASCRGRQASFRRSDLIALVALAGAFALRAARKTVA